MNDPISLDDLSAYLDDELPPARRGAVAAALARDPELRAALDALAWTAGVVAGASLPELPAGRSLRLPAAERTAQPRTRDGMPGAWTAWRSLASLAAVIALGAGLVAAWATVSRGGPGAPFPGSAEMAAAPERAEGSGEGLGGETGASAPDAGSAAVADGVDAGEANEAAVPDAAEAPQASVLHTASTADPSRYAAGGDREVAAVHTSPAPALPADTLVDGLEARPEDGPGAARTRAISPAIVALVILAALAALAAMSPRGR